MKKILFLASALTCLAGIPAANAQLIIQPTIIESAPPAYVVAPSPEVVVTTPAYPVHIDHHHRYDWRYWQERREHEERR